MAVGQKTINVGELFERACGLTHEPVVLMSLLAMDPLGPVYDRNVHAFYMHETSSLTD